MLRRVELVSHSLDEMDRRIQSFQSGPVVTWVMSTRDEHIEFKSYDDFTQYVADNCTVGENGYLYFLYHPWHAPLGTAVELVFRDIHYIVRYLEHTCCSKRIYE